MFSLRLLKVYLTTFSHPLASSSSYHHKVIFTTADFFGIAFSTTDNQTFSCCRVGRRAVIILFFLNVVIHAPLTGNKNKDYTGKLNNDF